MTRGIFKSWSLAVAVLGGCAVADDRDDDPSREACVAFCNLAYCTPAVEYEPSTLEACGDNCVERGQQAGAVNPACDRSFRAYVSCVAELDCEAWLDFADGETNACSAATEAVMNDCPELSLDFSSATG